MLNFLRRQKFVSGALEDLRSKEERLKDFRFEELAAATPVVEWKEKPMSAWKHYPPVRNQKNSYSCVAFSKALELGILNLLEAKEGEFVLSSARDIYTRRRNQGSGGMWGQDANQICINTGATLETLMPSDNKNEAEMNKADDRRPHKEVVGKIFRAKNWIALPFNIDAIASVLSTGKGVNVFFRFTYREWDRPVPVLSSQMPDLHHSVTATDFILWEGKKSLIIQDSWGLRNTHNGRRVLTEDWISRLTWVSYFEDLSNWDLIKKEELKKPRNVNFQKDLFFGMRNNPDVVILQKILKYEGFFPLTQEETGNFFGITRKAVIQLQEKYADEILTPIGLLKGTGFVGKLTREFLNRRYGS